MKELLFCVLALTFGIIVFFSTFMILLFKAAFEVLADDQVKIEFNNLVRDILNIINIRLNILD